MVTICILAGLGLAVCGIMIACATKTGRKEPPADSPPSLPPRINTGIPAPTVSQPQTRDSSSPAARVLPPRRASVPATAGADRSSAGAGCGPRGIRPSQFPCCPFDKQRNVSGQRRAIFWDSQANCYLCSRGHRVKSNGKPL